MEVTQDTQAAQATQVTDEMLRYFSMLNDDEQKSVVNMFKTILDNRSEWGPQTIEEYNRELEEGDAEIEAGNFIEHEEIMKKHDL